MADTFQHYLRERVMAMPVEDRLRLFLDGVGADDDPDIDLLRGILRGEEYDDEASPNEQPEEPRLEAEGPVEADPGHPGRQTMKKKDGALLSEKKFENAARDIAAHYALTKDEALEALADASRVKHEPQPERIRIPPPAWLETAEVPSRETEVAPPEPPKKIRHRIELEQVAAVPGVRALIELRLGVTTQAVPLETGWGIVFEHPPVPDDVDLYGFLRPEIMPPWAPADPEAGS